jgi:hypothetical protein
MDAPGVWRVWALTERDAALPSIMVVIAIRGRERRRGFIVVLLFNI